MTEDPQHAADLEAVELTRCDRGRPHAISDGFTIRFPHFVHFASAGSCMEVLLRLGGDVVLAVNAASALPNLARPTRGACVVFSPVPFIPFQLLQAQNPCIVDADCSREENRSLC